MKWNVRRLSLVSATLWGLCGTGIVGAQETTAPEAKKPEPAQVEAVQQTIELEVVAQPGVPGAPNGQQPLRVMVVAPPGGAPQLKPMLVERAGQRRLQIVTVNADDTGAGPVEAGAVAVTLGEYWLGVQLGELTDLVKSHLSLDHGLVVNEVLPDSPAVKAGLKTHDIILAVNDKPTNEATDLIEAVNTAKETELTLTIVRGGKKETIKATPAKRPEQVAQAAVQDLVVDGETQWSKVHEALKKLNVAPGQPPVHVWAFGQPQVVPPGVAVPQVHVVQAQAGTHATLPNNCQVQITKQGDSPAKIVVKQGDKSYEATEDKLDSLPEGIREPVRSMLGRRVTVQMGHAMAPGFAPVPAGVPGVPFVPAQPVTPGVIYANPHGPVAVPHPSITARLPHAATPPAAHEEVSKKLDSILQRLDKLQSEIEGMKK